MAPYADLESKRSYDREYRRWERLLRNSHESGDDSRGDRNDSSWSVDADQLSCERGTGEIGPLVALILGVVLAAVVVAWVRSRDVVETNDPEPRYLSLPSSPPPRNLSTHPFAPMWRT